MSPQYRCLLKLLTEVSNVLCEKSIILVELLFELRIVFIQDSEDGKRTVCKQCARKIVNCYRLFAELREALAGGRALDEGERFIASSAPGHKHLRQPVLVVQFLFEAGDLAAEVTPKAGSACENEAEGVQRRPSTKRALFSDQYSELEDEITSPISRADENLRRTCFRLTSRLSRHNFCSLF